MCVKGCVFVCLFEISCVLVCARVCYMNLKLILSIHVLICA